MDEAGVAQTETSAQAPHSPTVHDLPLLDIEEYDVNGFPLFSLSSSYVGF